LTADGGRRDQRPGEKHQSAAGMEMHDLDQLARVTAGWQGFLFHGLQISRQDAKK